MSERKRSPNWLRAEKVLLLDLVTEHFSVIENKKTCGASMKQKLAEWDKICQKYNSQTIGVHRLVENLKAQWDSMKKTCKKNASSMKQSLLQTGGGPTKPFDSDPIHDRILALLSTSAVGLTNKYDRDSMTINTHQENENLTLEDLAHPKVPDMLNAIEFEDTFLPQAVIISNYGDIASTSQTVIIEDSDDKAPKQDWGDYTPMLLQTPVSSELRVDKRKREEHTPKTNKKFSKHRPSPPGANTLDTLHLRKTKAVNLQIEYAQQEREEARKLFEINLEIKKENLKQEKLKTRLLLLELRKVKKNLNN